MVLTTISDDDLLRYNRMGLIPGPTEDEAEFLKRVDHCLHLKKHMEAQLGEEISMEIENEVSQELLQHAAPMMRELFDIDPHWIPIIFTNHRLAPWHGGCAWIFQFTDETPVAAFFQLRRIFATSSHYLWIYNREELITHESAHVGRMVFEEPKFEELLAYRTAKSSFRRWFGPIIQSSWECAAFILSLALVIIVDLFFVVAGHAEVYYRMSWLKILPILLVGFGVGRLWWRQKIFSKCLSKLKNILKDKKKANAVIYRLRDKEIFNFSRLSPNEIQDYIAENKNLSLRWRAISKSYFS